jgi:hypothetical protein
VAIPSTAARFKLACVRSWHALMEPISQVWIVIQANKACAFVPDGATMTDGFLNIDSTGIGRHVSLAWGYHSDRTDDMPESYLRTAIGWLPIAVILVLAAWVLVNQAWLRAPAGPMHLAAAISAKPGSVGATVGLAKEPSFNPAISEAIVPVQPAPVDRLKISSQSWRRGGLGSNALVTMTLRNDNGYAVRDIDIACAFQRPDGTHLTDRSRLINDIVNTKSRKTFTRLHVGFVNVKAAKAKCSLVGASHI